MNSIDVVDIEALTRYWEELSLEEKVALLQQIAAIDRETLQRQRELLNTPAPVCEVIEPFKDYVKVDSLHDREVGEKLLAEGQVGCLLIAGGQGSRLQFDKPKGMYPISDTGQTLFELMAEQVAAASAKARKPLPLAVMTSTLNDVETRAFFKKNHFFGLAPTQVFFYSQGMLPFLDQQGKLFLASKTKIAEGPDGNGSSLEHFVQSGIAQLWSQQGIRYVTYIPIDNPLADPFDPTLIGFHYREQLDVTIKCIARDDPYESVGVLVQREGKIEVIEYSELPEEERCARDARGELCHPCANISLFCFSMAFIEQLVHGEWMMPLHKAFKATSYLSSTGRVIKAKKPVAWKYEKFIFDILPRAQRVKALLYPRASCFAPLKNLHGPDSVESVRAALRRRF